MNFIGFNSLRNSKQVLRLVYSSSVANKQQLKRAYASAKIDEPIKFSTSKAASYDPATTFINPGGRKSQPIYQPFIITFFMVTAFAWCVVREENSMDATMWRPLDELVPNIKEQTLRVSISNYEKMGLDTRELKEALNVEVKKRVEMEKTVKEQNAVVKK